MMPSKLIDEVRSRRVPAIAALAALVALALALPLLFLKSAPEDAPAANAAAPAVAEEAKLPERAARLLATSDADAAAGESKGSAQDPFRPPAGYRAAAAKAAAKKAAGAPAADARASAPKNAAGSGGGSLTKPVPVVIQNADGSRPKPGGSSSGGSTTATAPATASTGEMTVDIRYGALQNSRIRRAIPRLKPFYIHGKLVAIFVRYSPSRKKASFAVAPGVHISGPVKCRRQDGACRYVDIPAGSHVRLTMLSSTRKIVSRRLDVVHTRWRASTSTRAAAGDGDNACLLRKLLAQDPGDVPLERDVCER